MSDQTIDQSEERKFLQELASTLATASGMAEVTLEQIKAREDSDEKDLMRLEKAVSQIKRCVELVNKRKSDAHMKQSKNKAA